MALYSQQYQEAEDVPGVSDGRRDVCDSPVCAHPERYRPFSGRTPWVPHRLSRVFYPAGTPRPGFPLYGRPVQRLVSEALWDEAAMLETYHRLVQDERGEPDGVLLVD